MRTVSKITKDLLGMMEREKQIIRQKLRRYGTPIDKHFLKAKDNIPDKNILQFDPSTGELIISKTSSLGNIVVDSIYKDGFFVRQSASGRHYA